MSESGEPKEFDGGDAYYWRGQVVPRLREISSSPGFLLSLALAVLTGSIVDRLPVADVPISRVTELGVSFASIALGACVSATVLSIGLPGARRATAWSITDGSVKDKSVLSDLVFVLTWASVSQFALLVVCVLSTLFGGEIVVAPAGMYFSHRLALIGSLFVAFYAIAELFTVIVTLSQIAAVIIAEERSRAGV